MASSKFSAPFFKKSPLNGAYTEAADGMKDISNAGDMQNLQDSILGSTLSAIEGAKYRNNPEASDKEYSEDALEERIFGDKDYTGFGNGKAVKIEDINVYDESDLEFDNEMEDIDDLITKKTS